MDSTTNDVASSPPTSVYSGVPESEFNEISVSGKTSSDRDILRELQTTGKIVTRFELDIASACEKLINLNLLSMHVEIRESEFEASFSDIDHNSSDLCVKALEFDYLSGFLVSEVRELEDHISDLRIQKANLQEFLSSRKHFGEPLMVMEDMLCDSEKSLEQSLEQVLEIKVRSFNFERNLLRFAGAESLKDKDYAESSPDEDLLYLKEKIKMQTVEDQRHILRMLEKSLKRELDFEKEVENLTQIKEGLTMRLHASEQDVLYAEEEAEIALEKLYASDNTCELLMGTFKELSSEMQMLESNLKGSVQRESEFKEDKGVNEAMKGDHHAQSVKGDHNDHQAQSDNQTHDHQAQNVSSSQEHKRSIRLLFNSYLKDIFVNKHR